MMMYFKYSIFGAVILAAGNAAATCEQTGDWPDLYNFTKIPRLHIKIKSQDWDAILNDGYLDTPTPYLQEKPSLLWEECDGPDFAQLVSIRQKSNDPITISGKKVSFKIDINMFEGQDSRAQKKWKEVQKLSLENGDDQNVVTEQINWHLQSSAKAAGLYPEYHVPGMANFCTLTVHQVIGTSADPFDFEGTSETVSWEGVYVNVEQPDKRFLKNRNIWETDATWLYKKSELSGAAEIKEWGCEAANPNANDSPTSALLNCSPFATSDRVCTKAEMDTLIDMEVLLATEALEGFMASLDGFFTKGKNYYYVDYSDATCASPGVRTRTFFEWDLDSAGTALSHNVYEGTASGGGGGGGGGGKGGGGKPGRLLGKPPKQQQRTQSNYQRVVFSHEEYLNMYNQCLLELTSSDPSKAVAKTIDYLEFMNTMTELPTLLSNDPNSKGALNELQGNRASWLQSRQSIVAGQICYDYSKSGLCT